MAIASARQSQGVASAARSNPNLDKKLKLPLGFPRVSGLFSDFRRHFGGTWLSVVEELTKAEQRHGIEVVEIKSQEQLDSRARAWERQLSKFPVRVVDDAIAEIVTKALVHGDTRAPSLNKIYFHCQKIVDEQGGSSNREAARAARARAKAELERMGVIDGRG